MTRFYTALFACCMMYEQVMDRWLPGFEVASVKISSAGSRPGTCKGGPGTSDPGFFTCTNWSVSYLVSRAFHLHSYELPSLDSLAPTKCEISAKVPPGTTKEQFDQMLQRLLVERFQLSYHFEKRQVQAYNLVIAKGGLKMRESPPPARVVLEDQGQPVQQPERREPKLETDADGYPIVETPPRGSQSMADVNGRIRWTARDTGMETIVALISSYMDGPVADLTRLQGRYDLTLSWGRDRDGVSDEGVPTLVEAIQKLLGLKLDKKKQFVDVFVVDHMEARPIGN